MDKKIIELFEQGLTLKKIAKAVDVPVEDVKRIVTAKYYVSSKKPKPCFNEDEVREFARTHTASETALAFGIKEANMYLYFRKHNIVATKRCKVGQGANKRAEEVLEIARNSNCETYAELAKQLLEDAQARPKM